MTETDQEGAVILAERIRKAVESLAIPHSGSDISEFVTGSLGLVTIQSTKLDLPEQVVALADAAMYRAKKEGRNRISIINEEEIYNLNKLE